ncbi:MAG: protein kinase [Candidatus Krumholzibacteria bacterium]|nr:protein kinase [Candidatus Krumholzibacteria bacterium]
MLGETISHYKIIEKLGEGGMGLVYRAVDTKLDREVAIKLLPSHLSADPEAVKRFIREAKAASALNHSAIGVIHEIDETEQGQTFIVMALYEGGTLRERIDRGKLTMNETVTIASQIASGLSRAHEKGIVHRDIKPQNILLNRDGEAKIIDFGLAKLAGVTKLTKEGGTLGTAAYMSPEQARGEDVDRRSDIFSLGTILYEMLAGETPFKGEHEAALLYEIVHEDPVHVSDRCKDIPVELCAIVEMALNKDSSERYQSATEMKADLKNISGASKDSTSRSKAMVSGKKGRGKSKWIGIAAAVVIVAAVIFFINTGREPAPLRASEMSLAVVDFRDMLPLADPLTSATMTELLNIALIEACPIRVKSPEHLRDIRRRIFGSTDSRIEEGQELEIARESEATYVITGRISIRGDEGFVTWRLIDVRSGESIGGGKVEPGKMNVMINNIVAAVLPEIASNSGIKQPVKQVPVEQITTASSSAYEHYIKGRLRVIEYSQEEAMREFEAAISIDTTFALAYFEMAKLSFGSNAIVQDIALARRYTAAAWRHAEKLGVKSRLHIKAFQHGLDYEVTLEMSTFDEMLDRWPDDRETLRIISGRAYYWGCWSEVVETGRKGMELYPDDPIIGGPTMSSALRNLHRFEESLKVSESYLERFPDNPNGWDELALSYLALGLPDSAEVAYQKAFDLDPGWIKQGMSYCAYHDGDLDKAISITENILSQKNLRNDYRLWIMCTFTHNINLPMLYYEAGRYFDAVRTMDEARQYVGGDPSYWQFQAGRLFLSVGLSERALEIAEEMESSDEIRVRIFAYRFKGLAQVAVGDLAGARATSIRTHELAETIGPLLKHPAYEIDAEIALSKKDQLSAIRAVKAMRELGLLFHGILGVEDLSLLAEAYYIAGDLKEAIDVHKELLHIYGGHAISHYHLGLIYEEMGRPQDAQQEFTKFLEMWANADEGLPQLADARKRLAELKDI